VIKGDREDGEGPKCARTRYERWDKLFLFKKINKAGKKEFKKCVEDDDVELSRYRCSVFVKGRR
jgi:hypothetical protein